MTRTVYSLLVGIDAYQAPVPALNGCVNDVVAIGDLLSQRVAGEGLRLEPKTLFGQQATRQAVIDGFRAHLGRARAGDVVLFYYSGHGSQEDAPPEFWRFEPDRLDETLVCWDSRMPGRFDLADKELAQLIAEVAESGPHVLIVLDCCHSGSGTRAAPQCGISIRRAPTDRRPRPLDSFIVSPEQVDRQPMLKVRLTNRSGERLYCALLDLMEDYGVEHGLLGRGGKWLEPGQTAWANDGNPLYPLVPKALWQPGITEFNDLLKLIVSTSEFDAALLAQPALDIPFDRGVRAGASPPRNTLERPSRRVQTRSLRTEPEDDEPISEWVTSQVDIVTIRPLDAVAVPRHGEASLAAGLTMLAHPALAAAARLDTLPSAVLAAPQFSMDGSADGRYQPLEGARREAARRWRPAWVLNSCCVRPQPRRPSPR